MLKHTLVHLLFGNPFDSNHKDVIKKLLQALGWILSPVKEFFILPFFIRKYMIKICLNKPCLRKWTRLSLEYTSWRFQELIITACMQYLALSFQKCTTQTRQWHGESVYLYKLLPVVKSINYSILLKFIPTWVLKRKK